MRRQEDEKDVDGRGTWPPMTCVRRINLRFADRFRNQEGHFKSQTKGCPLKFDRECC